MIVEESFKVDQSDYEDLYKQQKSMFKIPAIQGKRSSTNMDKKYKHRGSYKKVMISDALKQNWSVQ
jgi:hypothetical protein